MENIDKLMAVADKMAHQSKHRRVLKEKYQSENILFYNGGQFEVTRGLLSFINILMHGLDHKVVVVDDLEFPILISNLQDFYETLISQYAKAANSYYLAFNALHEIDK
jgi:hypothetical protein